jgi:ferritin
MQNFTTGVGNQQLSSKNLGILEEQLNQEYLMALKLTQYSKQCQDSELKNLCSRLARKHKDHYNTLLNYMLSHDSEQ